MYMAYVKSKKMGSKKRRVRKTRRIKGGEGKPTIDDAIGMVVKVKEFLDGMKTNSAPSEQPSAETSAESSGNP